MSWKPVWSTLPEASKACSELLKCSCKKGCTGRCRCFKSDLKCTELCFCSGGCTNSQDSYENILRFHFSSCYLHQYLLHIQNRNSTFMICFIVCVKLDVSPQIMPSLYNLTSTPVQQFLQPPRTLPPPTRRKNGKQSKQPPFFVP